MNEKDFVQLGISSALQKGLNSIGITVPTEISIYIKIFYCVVTFIMPN